MSIGMIPENRKATCWNATLLTRGESTIFPARNLKIFFDVK